MTSFELANLDVGVIPRNDANGNAAAALTGIGNMKRMALAVLRTKPIVSIPTIRISPLITEEIHA
jgi:hypothetical protein